MCTAKASLSKASWWPATSVRMVAWPVFLLMGGWLGYLFGIDQCGVWISSDRRMLVLDRSVDDAWRRHLRTSEKLLKDSRFCATMP